MMFAALRFSLSFGSPEPSVASQSRGVECVLLLVGAGMVVERNILMHDIFVVLHLIYLDQC
jgi:hypothetical protein